MIKVQGNRRASVSAAIGLIACSLLAGQAAASESWKEIETAARNEGAVVLYHNFAPASAEQIVAAFNEDYPEIQVSEVRLASAAFYQRFGTEYAAGRSEADVCSAAWDDVLESWQSQGWMSKWSPPEAVNIPAGMRYGDHMWTIQVAREMIVYNTNKVKEAEAPKEWTELFDPKWKGRIGMNPPWRSVGPQLAVAFMEDKAGVQDAAQKFKEQDIRFFNGSSGVLQAVIRGDVDVAQMTDLPLNGALADGVPVKGVYPSSGVPYTPIVTFVPAKAKNPNAGRVLSNWLMSERGQKTIQGVSGAPGTRTGLDAPKFVPSNSQISIVKNSELLNPEAQKRIVGEWRSVFNVK